MRMRELLFRAKRIDNGEWVEGFYSRSPKGNTYITTVGAQGCARPEKVDPETVCQYTGLTDKNGSKIYESDIVDILCEVDEIGVIEWNDVTASFSVSADGFTADFDNYRGTDLEVIDNIFDNPELVGRGSEE